MINIEAGINTKVLKSAAAKAQHHASWDKHKKCTRYNNASKIHSHLKSSTSYQEDGTSFERPKRKHFNSLQITKKNKK